MSHPYAVTSLTKQMVYSNPNFKNIKMLLK